MQTALGRTQAEGMVVAGNLAGRNKCRLVNGTQVPSGNLQQNSRLLVQVQVAAETKRT